jgi:hypothetical protein
MLTDWCSVKGRGLALVLCRVTQVIRRTLNPEQNPEHEENTQAHAD